MPAPTIIELGGLSPSQTTVTAPGAYAVVVSVLATNPQVTFQGPGNYTLATVASVLSETTFSAVGGANLTIDGLAGVASTTDLQVDGTSSITIADTIAVGSPINATYTGSGGTIAFAPGLLSLLTSIPSVTGFGAGDHLDFGAPVDPTDLIVYVPDAQNTAGALKLESSAGVVLDKVHLVGIYNATDFTLGAEGIDFACFLRGTHLLTAKGEVAVETLQAGDLVATFANGFMPVSAVRTRCFKAGMAGSDRVRPVRFAAGALGGGLPRCDLYVSPDHSMFLDGVLVPAQLLVNGRTITQPARAAAVEYFHVEIEPHDIIIAEGAACESYLDIGNRRHFGQPGVIALFPAVEPKSWEDACAPLLLNGPLLARIQARLNACADASPAAAAPAERLPHYA